MGVDTTYRWCMPGKRSEARSDTCLRFQVLVARYASFQVLVARYASELDDSVGVERRLNEAFLDD